MVGGPAICGVRDAEWIQGFLDFCKREGIRPDTITRHHYTVEFPERIGHYDYSKLEDSKMRFENLQATRDIVDSYEEFKGLPIHLTEFSTSYTPRGVIHDTNINAAYLARQLSGLGDVNEAYSYWTFGDVFEEQGVQNSLFHGGFGMVASGNIPKPTFWTFYFFKQLKLFSQKCVYRDDNAVIVKGNKGHAGILWNIDEGDKVKEISFDLKQKSNQETEYTLLTKTVDETCCNPLKLWHDLGEPAYPTKEETELIKSAAWPLTSSSVVKVSGVAGSDSADDRNANDNKTSISIPVNKNGVVYFTLTERHFTPDRGYDYDKVVSFH
ncbi:GH39 family glycosyl hydrolase [Butyrivibrio sp. WCD3002]|uniref:GH39 family glycosyl hydrolase n=1 Tax=Butyrivibrio sp. WCD3002 TaxID=1280676 RepID=UPI00040373BF|nr:glycosyl hydrolase [Butyrivibrio sp. WCD3002]